MDKKKKVQALSTLLWAMKVKKKKLEKKQGGWGGQKATRFEIWHLQERNPGEINRGKAEAVPVISHGGGKKKKAATKAKGEKDVKRRIREEEATKAPIERVESFAKQKIGGAETENEKRDMAGLDKERKKS